MSTSVKITVEEYEAMIDRGEIVTIDPGGPINTPLDKTPRPGTDPCAS